MSTKKKAPVTKSKLELAAEELRRCRAITDRKHAAVVAAQKALSEAQKELQVAADAQAYVLVTVELLAAGLKDHRVVS